MNTRARKLRKDFLPCGDQRSIEENLNRLQDMYGYEEENVKIINEQSVHLTGSSVWGEADVVPDVYEDIKAGETYIFSFQLYNFNHGPLEIVAENNGELFVEGINDIFEITSDGEKYHLKTASGPMDIVATLERVGSTHPINHKYLPEGYPYEETVTNRTAIVEETMLTGGSNNGKRVYFDKVSVSKMIEKGKMYEVSIDGTKYTLECGQMEVGEGSKIPFLYNEIFEIGKYDSTKVNVDIKTTDTSLTSVSFSLYEVEEQTNRVPISHRFLPEGYPYEESGQVLILENEKIGGGPALGAKDGYGDTVNGNLAHLGVQAMVVGDTYTINVDGVDYTGICEHKADSTCLDGNGIKMFTSDAPVYLDCYSNGVYISFEDEDRHSVKIYHHATVVVPMAEKFLPTGAGIKTAIIKSSDYDNFLAGIATVKTDLTFESINMTFDEAMQTMMAGEPLQAVIMFVSSIAENQTIAVNAVGYVTVCVDPDSGEYTLAIIYEEDLITDKINHTLIWTSGGVVVSR